jgi:TatA/E family protein of Tat protein translocase
MFGIGVQELLIILVILLLLFGSKKLPELSRSIGQSFKEMRKGLTDSNDGKPEQTADKGSEAGNTKPHDQA